MGPILQRHADRFPTIPPDSLERLVGESAWLRKEREFAFYGDVDAVPTERYSCEDGERAWQAARLAVEVASTVIGKE